MANYRFELPPVVREKAVQLGADDWLRELPESIADLERRWRITVGPPYPDATEAFVARAERADGTAAVLKIMVERPDEPEPMRAAREEITVLDLAAGNGCAELFESDVESGALLIEQLGPALESLNRPLDERLEIMCGTASALWRPAPDRGLRTGAEKGRWLADAVVDFWQRGDEPCSERAIDHALACVERRIAAHDDERAVLVHGDVHQWNVLQAGTGFKLVDPDGILVEREYDLGILMREDPIELMRGDPRERSRWLAARCDADEQAIWEWGVVERVCTGMLATSIGLLPVGQDMLDAADAIAASDFA